MPRRREGGEEDRGRGKGVRWVEEGRGRGKGRRVSNHAVVLAAYCGLDQARFLLP